VGNAPFVMQALIPPLTQPLAKPVMILDVQLVLKLELANVVHA